MKKKEEYSPTHRKLLNESKLKIEHLNEVFEINKNLFSDTDEEKRY